MTKGDALARCGLVSTENFRDKVLIGDSIDINALVSVARLSDAVGVSEVQTEYIY